ncbi:Dynein heavy chain family protein [Trichomonas vaginalis G3]|uniref:Dynein heavy chain family protein n=1 Tax=Trichomonas vaginalis (strain ATCC PRA-98 / G3) TaxID=412133 RepID=A2DD83_TRIV3|nr:dynein heavy chain family protein family [Trichomonas vaginalis G3]EAY21562.1 Dynein heavy chain family protein [Trichomonas vaginalis G3]KAI5489771.1 dynein heavy chain family protein family [Trichomonas vaginalis G3]|eukprot:XP_001582548.1 Dynein heavy chain family protein [Trichomonas vaginalis G3]
MFARGRFQRGKSRLIEREEKMNEEKILNKSLKKTIPEETIKTPVIGEWSLNPKVEAKDPRLIEHLTAQSQLKQPRISYPSQAQTPETYQPSQREKEKRNLVSSMSLRSTHTFKIQTPNMNSPAKVMPEPKIDFPEGKTTTNLQEILRSKFVSPAEPLPPLQDPDSITDTKFLPLEYFDDLSCAQFDIPELMKDPRAVSKFTDFNGQTKWLPCKVIDFNEETQLFTIQWEPKEKGKVKEKKVPRFNIRFLREDPDKFEERVKVARHACTIYEATIRFNTRVSLMPTKELPDLPQNAVDGILKRLSTDIQDKGNSIIEEQIKPDFKLLNNKLNFINEINHNPLVPNREEFMLLEEEPPKVPESGLVTTISSFAKAQQYIKDNLLYGDAVIMNGLFSIWDIFQVSRSRSLILDNFNKVLALEDFITRQYTFLGSQSVEIRTAIEKRLKDVFAKIEKPLDQKSVDEKSKDDKNKEEKPKIDKQEINRRNSLMVGVTQRMMHTMLLDITSNTLTRYLELFKPKDVTDRDYHALFFIDLYYAPDNKLEFMPTPETFQDQVMSLLAQVETTITELPLFTSMKGEPLKIKFIDCLDSIAEAKSSLIEMLKGLFSQLNEFINSYRYLEKYLSLDPDDYAYDFDPSHTRTLEEYKVHLDDFKDRIADLKKKMKPYYNAGIFRVMTASFKQMTINHLENLQKSYLSLINKYMIQTVNSLNNEFTSIKVELQKSPNTPEELAELRKYLNTVIENKKTRQYKIERIKNEFQFLEDYRFETSDSDFHYIYKAYNMPVVTNQRIDETEKMITEARIKMIKELKNNQKQLENDALAISETLTTFIAKYNDLEYTSEAVEKINAISFQLKHLQELQQTYNKHEKLFEFEPNACRILIKLGDEFTPLHQLWNIANDWVMNYQSWLDTPFHQIRADQITLFVNHASKQLSKLKKELTNQPVLLTRVVAPLIQQIEGFKKRLPLITKLRHQGIKRQHWDKISQITGFEVKPTVETSLSTFLQYKLEEWDAQISDIANVAAQEYNIEAALDKMDAELRTTQFVTVQFRNSGHFILQQVDDLLMLIDDQLVATQSMLASPFITQVKDQANERIAFLRKSRAMIEAWMKCQTAWLYLQPIFAGTSIGQKLKTEASYWAICNTIWSKIMTMAHNHPNFYTIMQRDELMEQLVECSTKLEKVVLGLTQFLEQKRVAFPRFFFISNDELVYILSHTAEFDKIQDSMPKIFEYVHGFKRTNENAILEINDSTGESLKLVQQVDTMNKEIEDWLNYLDDEIHVTLKDQMKAAISNYSKKPREQWILDYPAQVIMVVNQILFTQSITNALKQHRFKGLNLVLPKFKENFQTLSKFVKEEHTPQERILLSSILTSEVHNRDKLEELIDNEINDVDAFLWIQQLRYYSEDDLIIVKSLNNSFEYTYEYVGNSPRLVLTPLTDRCYQTMLSAMKMFLGASPIGPAGTGKTETIRNLAKALGRPCIVYNCSEEVGPEIMSQFLAGISGSGAWACFDEFNRINIEVLSIIGQQIKTIQNAMAAVDDTFLLDTREITINRNLGITITLNPGYAGRSQLPDNIKLLFRTIVMIEPDYQHISEIILLSGGFDAANKISKEVTAVFKLGKLMLNKSNQYDWGLRQMKAILTTGINELHKKGAETEEDKETIILRAIKDCTLPRLLADDTPIFNNILRDVFPNIKDESTAPEDFIKKVEGAMEKMNLSKNEKLINKIYELYYILQVRHGLILVGGTLSGKSTSWKVLQKAFEDDPNPILIDCLNPKSVSITEMYGLYNPATSEWKDGIVSRLLRNCWFAERKQPHLIIADGPIDAVWIESMNTLLDDNKLLCLPNNERIPLDSKTKMLFEVDNLINATPATVSRCGLIYFDQVSIKWQDLIDGWCNKHDQFPDVIKIIKSQAEIYMNSYVQFISTDVKTVIRITPNIAVSNFLKLLDCFMPLLSKPAKDDMDDDDLPSGNRDRIDSNIYYSHFTMSTSERIPYIEVDNREIIFERIFQFCMTWAFGSFLDEDGRNAFDHFVRNIAETNNSRCIYPQRGSVFDYFADLTKYSWIPWLDNVTNMNFTDQENLDHQVVPTNEIASTFFLSRLLVANYKNTLIQGPESGKSLIMNTLQTKFFNKQPYITGKFDCSAITTPKMFMDFTSQYMHKQQGIYGPLPGDKLVFFIDNLASIEPDGFLTQPAIELMRELVTYGGWHYTSEFSELIGYTLLISTQMKGSGRYAISPRFIRNFFYIYQPKYTKPTIQSIVLTMYQKNLSKFIQSVHDITKNVVACVTEIVDQCHDQMLPIPSKPHYNFNLRTIMRILKGILLVGTMNIKNDVDFIRLFYHEMYREIYDRLNTTDDREWFNKNVVESCLKHFKIQYSAINGQNFLMFNNFSDATQIYKEVKQKPDQVLAYCASMLEEHNRSASQQLNMTLFHEAVEHISALSRATTLVRGHCLLVGMKGSWRRSLTKLMLHIENIDQFSISVTKGYGLSEWHEDMKRLIKKCCTHDEVTGFIITDAQILMREQLEDLENLMLYGEIPRLYERDEFEILKSEIAATEVAVDCDYHELMRRRVCNNLHIFLIVSPFGKVFHDIMLSFQVIRNECIVDWIIPWSDSALETIAQDSLGSNSVGSPDVVHSVVSTCVEIHKCVEQEARNFIEETGQVVSITPSLYFFLLKIFHKKLKIKQRENAEKARDYENGVSKIKLTGQMIGEMTEKHDHDIPELDRMSKDMEKLVQELTISKDEAEKSREVVKQQSLVAEKNASEANKANKIAQEQLKLAQPLLSDAQAAVMKLDKDSLVSIKKLHAPSTGMRDTFDAICIMFNRNPKKVDNPSTGLREDDYWPETIALLNDVQFVKNVTNFKVERLTQDQINKLKKYVPKEKPARMEKLRAANASFQAVAALYEWVCASFDYWHVYQEILPKQKMAEEAERLLQETNAQLTESRDHLEEIEAHLKDMQTKLSDTQLQEKELTNTVKDTEARLARARKLVSGLTNESTRWDEKATKLRNGAKFILGDTILISAILVYLGAFSPSYRAKLVQKWKEFLSKHAIKYSEDFSIVDALGTDITIRDWIIKGLPNDQQSIENALIITENDVSIPLLIDPQNSGLKWLRENYRENLRVLRVDQPDFMQSLCAAVSQGQQVIIENVATELDPSIAPILNREIATVDNKKQIVLGGDIISYNTNFRLYLTTQNPSPQFSPEVCSTCLLINFRATRDGLTDLLLNTMIEVEKSDLDKKRIQLMESNAENIAKLNETELEILKIVSDSEGKDILADDSAIETLSVAKKTAQNITLQISASEKTEQQISQFKKHYLPVVERATILYFCAADFCKIDPMYQFSLKWFDKTFRDALSKANHPSDHLQQIHAFTRAIQRTVFTRISLSLFNRHKLLYSTLAAIRVLEADNKITPEEISALLALAPVIEKSPIKWMTDDRWGYLRALENVNQAFKGIIGSIRANEFAWERYCNLPQPEKEQFPTKEQLTPFQRTILLKYLRLDRTQAVLTKFVTDVLGLEISSVPISSMQSILKDANSQEPIIFVASPGTDPTEDIQNALEAMDSTRYLKYYSLGRGRGPAAEALIQKCALEGYILLLQNCHLSLSWMPRVEFVLSTIQKKNLHPNFRLLCVTSSVPNFPIGLLFMSQKVIYETASGFKNNMLRLFNSLNEAEYTTSGDHTVAKQLLFHLCFFHSVVVERLQFGSLGWNNPYSFSFSDFAISKHQLQTLMSETRTATLPLEHFVFLLSEMNYGGSVTDEWDRRTLDCLANKYFNEGITATNYQLCEQLKIPPFTSSLKQTIAAITDWKDEADGPLVGLSNNAVQVTKKRRATKLFNNLLELQPVTTAINVVKQNDSRLQRITEISSQIPPLFNETAVKKRIEAEDQTIEAVISHEVSKFTILIETINRNLSILKDALNGTILLDDAYEVILKSILLNRVPERWLNVSFPSISNLNDYINDLRNRVFFIDNWIRNGSPLVYKIGAFFRPEEFLMALLQKYAHTHNVPLQSLGWMTTPLDIAQQQRMTDPPEEGIYIDGIFIEGARWDFAKDQLAECGTADKKNSLPVIHIKPAQLPLPYKMEVTYECPVFRTQQRGSQSIDSPGYVFSLFLATKARPEHWIEGSVSGFLNSK